MKKLWAILLVMFFIVCASAIAAPYYHGGTIPKAKPFQGDMSILYKEHVIAMTILGESIGEGEAGMYAVACVISQRSINRKLTPTQVCLQNRLVKGRRIHQFSCWNKGGPKLAGKLKTKQAAYALLLAMNIKSLKRDYVKNADHYCTLKTNNYWTRGKTPVAIIGNHKFYKLR